MHLEERIKNGMPFYEHGHTDPIDITVLAGRLRLGRENRKKNTEKSGKYLLPVAELLFIGQNW